MGALVLSRGRAVEQVRGDSPHREGLDGPGQNLTAICAT